MSNKWVFDNHWHFIAVDFPDCNKMEIQVEFANTINLRDVKELTVDMHKLLRDYFKKLEKR